MLRQENREFKVSLGYIERPCFKKIFFNLKNKLGMVVHTCNPSHLGGRDRRIETGQSGQKSYQDPNLKEQTWRQGMVHTWNPSYLEDVSGSKSEAGLGKKRETPPEK
jgi:hypothetical protein